MSLLKDARNALGDAGNTLRLLFTEASEAEQDQFATLIANRIREALPNQPFEEIQFGTTSLHTPRAEGGEYSFYINYEHGKSVVAVYAEAHDSTTSTTTAVKLNEFRELPTRSGINRLAGNAVATIQAPLTPKASRALGLETIN